MILVSHIVPFDAVQSIYVLTDNERDIIEKVPTKLHEYEKCVMELCNEYDIKKIELHGSEEFCARVKDKIAQAEFTKYNKNKIDIVLKGA